MIYAKFHAIKFMILLQNGQNAVKYQHLRLPEMLKHYSICILNFLDTARRILSQSITLFKKAQNHITKTKHHS